MSIHRLLERLNKVKKVRDGNYIACCPAHDDKNPSLSVSHVNDRTLINCHSHHCAPLDIVHAVGLELSDLFDQPRIPQTVFADNDWRDRKAARAVNHKIEKAVSYLHIAQASLEQGIKATPEEIKKIKYYREYLDNCQMTGTDPWWSR